MNRFDEAFPHPLSRDGVAWRKRCEARGEPDPCQDEDVYEVIVDGIPWEDADGMTTWTQAMADSVADVIRTLGYTDIRIEMVSS